MVSTRRIVIAVVGPTATGKSALAEALCAEFDGEVVSADSMQVYKGMDIGTAKIPASERNVAYHCLDLLAPNEQFNASTYQKAARQAFADIWARGKQPVLCGGTGLYLRAAIDDFALGSEDEQDEASSASDERQERRERLTARAEALGAEAFHAELAAKDAVSAALIHPHNVRRVVRAFEWLEEGSSYAEQAAGFDARNEVYPTIHLGLDMPRELLYERINQRVLQMLEDGLLQEVQHLLEQGYEQALTAQQAIGYKELVGVIRGTKELEEAVAEIQKATRNYAKRQLSWFRRDERIQWLDAQEPLTELTTKACSIITN